jgi:hypothetical protein
MRLFLTLAVALTLPLAAQSKKPGAKQKPAPKLTSMTGCVDQRGENFFLTDDRELKPIAELLGDDPENRSFAKYMGKKVTVKGALSPGGQLPKIQVREIAIVSEFCAPESP